MKFSAKHLSLLFAGSLFLAFNMGCGTDTPFQRGPHRGKDAQPESPTAKPQNPNEPPAEVPTPTVTVQPTPTPEPIALSRAYFESDILPMLDTSCNSCHDNPAPSFEQAQSLVILGKPAESILFKKATGAAGAHHRQIFKPDSPEALKLIAWISGKPL